MPFIKSTDIKVFPSSFRSAAIDADSRLTSEYNLTNIVNRLSSLDSFVIKIDQELGANPTSIEFNIHGYYFKLNLIVGETINYFDSFTSATKIAAKIRLKSIDTNVNDPSESTSYSASTIALQGITIDGTQLLPDSDNYFIGLELIDASAGDFTHTKIIDESDYIDYYFMLLTRATTSDNWGVPSSSMLKYNAAEIGINNVPITEFFNSDEIIVKNLTVSEGATIPGVLEPAISTTKAALAALRAASGLISGQQYKITNLGLNYDIILVADSANILNANGRAIKNSSFSGTDAEAYAISSLHLLCDLAVDGSTLNIVDNTILQQDISLDY